MTPAGRHGAKPIRVLLVDDSDASRAAVGRILRGRAAASSSSARARDGEEALREVLRLEPDLIFLDLQMPRMDGFTFLRLLMARRPTPVVVVSAQSRRSDVFKALELGALDFVAKPEDGASFDDDRRRRSSRSASSLRALRPENLAPRRERRRAAAARRGLAEPPRVVAIGASTGGPQALQRLLAALPGDLPVGFVVAQHMPERFTAAFAERLARTTRSACRRRRTATSSPPGASSSRRAGAHLEVRRDRDGALRAAVPAAGGGAARAKHCPSVDRLFASVARAARGRAPAGSCSRAWGRTAAAGIAAIKRGGGLTLAESQESAVVYGMPQAAAESGALDELLPLDGLAERIVAVRPGDLTGHGAPPRTRRRRQRRDAPAARLRAPADRRAWTRSRRRTAPTPGGSSRAPRSTSSSPTSTCRSSTG